MSKLDLTEDQLLWEPEPTATLMEKRLRRDEFAAQVLNGLYSNPETLALDYQYVQLAEIAYAQADAMIAERDKKAS